MGPMLHLGKNGMSLSFFNWGWILLYESANQWKKDRKRDICPFSVLQSFTGWWYTYPSEKYEFVSWNDDIPNILWKIKHVPNHHFLTFLCAPRLGKRDPSWVGLTRRDDRTFQSSNCVDIGQSVHCFGLSLERVWDTRKHPGIHCLQTSRRPRHSKNPRVHTNHMRLRQSYIVHNCLS